MSTWHESHKTRNVEQKLPDVLAASIPTGTAGCPGQEVDHRRNLDEDVVGIVVRPRVLGGSTGMI